MSEGSKVVEAKTAQREGAKRATLEAMRGKKPRRKEFSMELNGEELSFLFVGLGNKKYDKLFNQFPPTNEQLARGEGTNVDKFAPELLARVSKEPELTVEQWAEIWNSEDWSRGELIALYNEAGYLCIEQAAISPISAD